MIQKIVHLGARGSPLLSRNQHHPHRAKKESKNGEEKRKVRKRHLEADKDRTLIKKIKTGQSASTRNERQGERTTTVAQ